MIICFILKDLILQWATGNGQLAKES